MSKHSFEEVWGRIARFAGESFSTISDLDFTYEVKGRVFYPSRTDYQISKADFSKAYQLVPIEGPGKINDLVRGPAYVWAVLHDRRIPEGEW